MPPIGQILETMRSDWNRRAREDAYYYVGYAHLDQGTDVFQATAAPILPMLEGRIPAPVIQPSGVQSPRGSRRRRWTCVVANECAPALTGASAGAVRIQVLAYRSGRNLDPELQS